MTTMRAECATQGCSCVRGFSFDMQKPEAERLKRKVFAVAGWLDMKVLDEATSLLGPEQAK
jgi:hypothetical protein